jgi:hypothetical protein
MSAAHGERSPRSSRGQPSYDQADPLVRHAVAFGASKPGNDGDSGRSGEIRTPDPLLPKQVRYQAALHSVWLEVTYIDKRL